MDHSSVSRVEPLAIHDVTTRENIAECRNMVFRPTLQQIELTFARTSRENMRPALQDEGSVAVEIDAGIRSV